MADHTYSGWYRFNVPNPGDPTTVDATTTNETTLYKTYPAHVLPTTYAYNSTNQVTQQNAPDGGTNRFWYDLLSRLSVSQNDKQLPANNYSYTDYDAIGRITEVGQKNQTTVNIGSPDYLAAATLQSFTAAGANSQITDTYYDAPVPTVSGNTNGIATLPQQSYLRKRVAASTYTETQGSPALRATYYNYDLDGNVKTLWQQTNGLYQNSSNTGLKRIDYEYDLVSGKVNFVRYQGGQPDAFYYRYTYDADNRITGAYSSTVAVVDTALGSYLPASIRKKDAAYSYYLHGPLQRLVLGDLGAGVQGVDYAYTLQGWLKGVNSTAATAAADMGQDGADVNHPVARDAYGYNLYYYNTDYAPIVTTNKPFATTLQTGSYLRQLYNGNIAAGSINIPQLNGGAYWLDKVYTYDQLNRIKSATAYHTASVSSTPVKNGDYDETFTYDGNGNILTLTRTGAGTGTLTDNLAYTYNRNSAGRLLNNQLNFLNGHAGASNITPDQAANNYTYDQIGELTADVQAGLTAVGWNVYGKITNINKASGNLTYTYNPAGQRVSKTLSSLTTWYIRDAQGNTLAVYNNAHSNVNWMEQHLYGSSRLGMWTPGVNLAAGNSLFSWDTVGRKQYELTDYRNNLMTTVTDKRLQHTTNNTSIDYFKADIATAQDYYSFGSMMPGMTYNYSANIYYRYGFNGKENDNEVRGTGNQQDYGQRIYVDWIGRFLSVDPIAGQYPELTPYQFASNSPIKFIDLDGKEATESESEKAAEEDMRDPRTEEAERSLKFPEDEVLKREEGLRRKEEAQRKAQEDKLIRRPPGEKLLTRPGFISRFGGRVQTYLNDLPENTANALGNQTVDFKKIIEEGAAENLATNRYLPGKATGTGVKVNGQWLRGTDRNAGFVPNSIAEKLNGRGFNSFDEFRSAFWMEVAADRDLAKQFSTTDLYRMKAGAAPLVTPEQTLGGQKSYILHHIVPIGRGGGVYDMNNIIITTPLFHNSILSPTYHYNSGGTNGTQ